MEKIKKVAVAGAGSMGSGIAQIAAQNGCEVVVYDLSSKALDKAKTNLIKTLDKLVEKGKLSTEQSQETLRSHHFTSNLADIDGSGFFIEAVIERLDVKLELLKAAEPLLTDQAIIATNTSSLSIASLSAALKHPERFIGVHFFNPAPVMPLVEIIPGVATSTICTEQTNALIQSWKKTTVIAKDTPGFIVNRIARPFYGEALRIYEEGLGSFADIDYAMKHFGEFRMGPFELMDFIGNDVNYAVTESVFTAFFYDPRYKPSFTQKRYAEAGFLGRKTGRGYYQYPSEMPAHSITESDGRAIFERIIAMLVNEAYDALFWNIASAESLETAMTKGVNYPKGLLAWGKEIGLQKIVTIIDQLHERFKEDRYRVSPLLRELAG